VAEVHCKSDWIGNTSYLICGAHGWEGNKSGCLKKCKQSEKISGLTLKYNHLEAEYSCKDGQTATLTCKNGTWSGEIPSCNVESSELTLEESKNSLLISKSEKTTKRNVIKEVSLVTKISQITTTPRRKPAEIQELPHAAIEKEWLENKAVPFNHVSIHVCLFVIIVIRIINIYM